MIRFILIVILFFMGLLCVFKAPVYILWFGAILVEEFPWIFVILDALLLLWGAKAQRFQIPGNYLAGISLLLFLSPVVRAYVVAAGLRQGLQNSFAAEDVSPGAFPFRLSGMVTGLNAPQIGYKRLIYADKDGVSLTLDYYQSTLKGDRPCVVVVHGGSWAAGDSRQVPELNSVLAKDGYNVAAINYRLAPKFKSPAPVEDVADALSYLKSHKHELAIDTTKFVLLGRSAGGQIALTAAYTLHDASIKGVIGFYAPADMVWGYSQPSNPMIMDSRKVMEDYLGGTYKRVPENYVASSAIDFVTPASVPTLLVHGQNDVLVFYEHSVRLTKKLEENHVRHYLLTLPWATHGCDYTLTGPGGQLSTYSVLYFLNQILRTAPGSK